MAKQTINVGTTANDRTGEPLRSAFIKINQNFTEVYNSIASTANNTGDITFSGTSIIGGPAVGTNGLIRLIPNNGTFQGSANGYTTFGQYLDIYPTNQYDSPHIHIAPGKGSQGTGDLVLGDDNFNIQVNNTGIITVVSRDPVSHTNKSWYYGQDGVLYGSAAGDRLLVKSLGNEPGTNLNISVSNQLEVKTEIEFSSATGDPDTTFSIDTTIWPLIGIENSPYCNFYISPGVYVSPISITREIGAGDIIFEFADPVSFAANTSYYVYYSEVSNPDIALVTDNGEWNFKDNGSLEINGSTTIATNGWGNMANPGVSTVIYTSKGSDLSSIRVHATIEGFLDGINDDGYYHTQACDMMIVRRVGPNTSVIVDSVVYGVIYTSTVPLATLDANWNPAANLGNGAIEITAIPTATTNPVYVKINATEVYRGD